MKKTVWKNVWQTAAALGFLVCLWFAVWAIVGNDYVFPSFFDAVKAFFVYFARAAFYRALGGTLLRVLTAFLLSFIFAALLSLVAYLYPSFARIFAPIVAVIRVLPVFAVLFLLLSWTNAWTVPVLVAFLSLFPVLYTSFLGSFSAVDNGLVEMSKTYNVPLKKRILQLYVPSVTPFVVKEIGAGLGFAIKLVVSAEVLVYTANSLGGLVIETQYVYTALPQTFALVLTACLLGFMFECIGGVLSKRLQRRWQ